MVIMWIVVMEVGTGKFVREWNGNEVIGTGWYGEIHSMGCEWEKNSRRRGGDVWTIYFTVSLASSDLPVCKLGLLTEYGSNLI